MLATYLPSNLSNYDRYGGDFAETAATIFHCKGIPSPCFQARYLTFSVLVYCKGFSVSRLPQYALPCGNPNLLYDRKRLFQVRYGYQLDVGAVPVERGYALLRYHCLFEAHSLGFTYAL